MASKDGLILLFFIVNREKKTCGGKASNCFDRSRNYNKVHTSMMILKWKHKQTVEKLTNVQS